MEVDRHKETRSASGEVGQSKTWSSPVAESLIPTRRMVTHAPPYSTNACRSALDRQKSKVSSERLTISHQMAPLPCLHRLSLVVSPSWSESVESKDRRSRSLRRNDESLAGDESRDCEAEDR